MNGIVAIDPGVGGAMVVKDLAGDMKTYPMPTEDSFETLKHYAVLEYSFVIEQVPYTAGFNRPAARIAKLFESSAFTRGVLRGLGAKIVMVRPQEWQKLFQPLSKAYTARKTEIWEKVKEIYPEQKITKKAADAYAIMYWFETTVEESK
jgi:hypothetical protein